MIELLVVIVIIGVLFAIAAPNWVAFINQQRVGSARNQVAQAIRSAQSEAQRTRVRRAIVFENDNNQPRYAVVPLVPNPTDSSKYELPPDRSKFNWQRLGDGAIQPGTIRLWGNQGGDRTRPSELIFDAYGSVFNKASLPYTITIGSTASKNPRRCVVVETLLGGIRESSDGTVTTGCPEN